LLAGIDFKSLISIGNKYSWLWERGNFIVHNCSPKFSQIQKYAGLTGSARGKESICIQPSRHEYPHCAKKIGNGRHCENLKFQEQFKEEL
jgi:hypothetical protein